MSVIRHPNTAGATLTQWRYTATGGETSLSGTDGFSTALSYTVGSEQVFINGVLLERGVDYAATTGTTITGLTALVANDIATVISPSSFNVANAIPKSTVTAKGDLLAATGASTVTNLPVGADGTTLVADSSTSTGLRYTAGTVQSNPVLNSAMQVWQRGTTFAISNTSAYTADRWQGRVSAVCTTSFSRQATGDTTNLPNIQYATRVQRASGQTATPLLILEQSFETINSIPFAGKTVTFSFYARAGANYSSASNLLNVYLYSGTGTDQNISGSYTGVSNIIFSTPTLTTTWQRFTYTGTVPSTCTEIAAQFFYTAVGTAGTNDYFDVTGVQIDIGSVALPFRTYAGTLQGELAACQRYYWKTQGSSTSNYWGTSSAATTTILDFYIQSPVNMRTFPTGIEIANIDFISGGTRYNTGTYALNTSTTNGFNLRYTHGSAVFTSGSAVGVYGAVSGTPFIAANAEL